MPLPTIAELSEFRVRLRVVDAPDAGHRDGCDGEREAATGATAFVEHALEIAETVVVRSRVWQVGRSCYI